MAKSLPFIVVLVDSHMDSLLMIRSRTRRPRSMPEFASSPAYCSIWLSAGQPTGHQLNLNIGLKGSEKGMVS